MAHEGWAVRKEKKKKAMECAADEAAEEIENAILALEAQRDELSEKRKNHAALWLQHTNRLETAHTDRVHELVLLMEDKQPSPQSPMAVDPNIHAAGVSVSQMQDLADLRAEMQAQIRSQLEAHTALVAENNARFESAIARWERHCESLSAQLAKHVEVTALSPTETDQRMAHAESVRKGPTPTPPLLADGAEVGGALKAVIVAGSVEANY